MHSKVPIPLQSKGCTNQRGLTHGANAIRNTDGVHCMGGIRPENAPTAASTLNTLPRDHAASRHERSLALPFLFFPFLFSPEKAKSLRWLARAGRSSRSRPKASAGRSSRPKARVGRRRTGLLGVMDVCGGLKWSKRLPAPTYGNAARSAFSLPVNFAAHDSHSPPFGTSVCWIRASIVPGSHKNTCQFSRGTPGEHEVFAPRVRRRRKPEKPVVKTRAKRAPPQNFIRASRL